MGNIFLHINILVDKGEKWKTVDQLCTDYFKSNATKGKKALAGVFVFLMDAAKEHYFMNK